MWVARPCAGFCRWTVKNSDSERVLWTRVFFRMALEAPSTHLAVWSCLVYGGFTQKGRLFEFSTILSCAVKTTAGTAWESAISVFPADGVQARKNTRLSKRNFRNTEGFLRKVGRFESSVFVPSTFYSSDLVRLWWSLMSNFQNEDMTKCALDFWKLDGKEDHWRPSTPLQVRQCSSVRWWRISFGSPSDDVGNSTRMPPQDTGDLLWHFTDVCCDRLLYVSSSVAGIPSIFCSMIWVTPLKASAILKRNCARLQIIAQSKTSKTSVNETRLIQVNETD